MADRALVGGDTGIFAGVGESEQKKFGGFGVVVLGVKRQSQEDIEFAIVGKLRLARPEDLGGAGELPGVTERGAETEERAGEFVGREADVITVVRSDDLDAGEAEGGLGEQREREEWNRT